MPLSISVTLSLMSTDPGRDDHEVYPNAPLALVAVEVRLTDSTGVSRRTLPTSAQRSFRDMLGDNWVTQPVNAPQMSLAFGVSGAQPIQQPLQSFSLPRFTVRDRTLAVTITDSGVIIEATRYRHYWDFRELLAKAVTAAAKVLSPDGVSRVGMRYINEIRAPGSSEQGPAVWQRWVDDSLLAPQFAQMSRDGFVPTAWEGMAQYQTGPDQRLVLRYGPRNEYLVNPTGPLKRPSVPPPGPLFMLDLDCFWEPPDIPEFDPETIIGTFDQLRVPIRSMFQLLITDELIAELRKEPINGR